MLLFAGSTQHSVFVALMPLKLQLDQHAVGFLQAFGDGLNLGSTPSGGPRHSCGSRRLAAVGAAGRFQAQLNIFCWLQEGRNLLRH